MSDKWPNIPDGKTISHAVEAIKSRGIEVFLADSKKEALEKLISLIPKGAEIMNGTSTTLQEIGFVGFLKSGKHGWKNLQEEILKESDWPKQAELRRQATIAEYFLGSVNAISKNGELVACDASGSRVGAYLFSAKNLILVAGVNKITPSLETAMQRVREQAFPLENERAMKAYGMGSSTAKWAIIEKDRPGRTKLILVKEKLGF